MDKLPLASEFSSNGRTVRNHKLKHGLDYSNGCRTICDATINSSKRVLGSSSTRYAQEIPEEVIYDPILTYGRTSSYAHRQVIPHHVLYAQKCLKFKAFFRQCVFNSPSESHRVRHVNIIYFLEDDTMCVVEPPIVNAGLVQGRLVRRAKIAKSPDGKYYHWKDLNVGIDIEIYGIVYHTVDCDIFTNEFLRSQGIDVGDREEPPSDSYIQDRKAKEIATQKTMVTSKQSRSAYNSCRKFLDHTGMILTFEALWNDSFYHVIYFLTDDTMIVKEISKRNNDRDSHRILLRRMRVPKNWVDMPSTFPSIYLERGDTEVSEYYTPTDLRVGQTIFIFGRRFLLCDCDNFTRNYYSEMLNIEQPPRISQTDSEPPSSHRNDEQIRPRTYLKKNDTAKQKDIIRHLLNYPDKLRYLASMEAIHPEDEGREFVFEYNLNDGKVKINEIGKRNSGHRAGCFLSFTLIPKPKKLGNADDNMTDDNIAHYSPEDFFIGAQINVFNHRFVIKGADLSVLRYIETNIDNFSPQFVENIMNYFNETKESVKKVDLHSHESEKITRESILSAKLRVNSPLSVPHNVTSNSPSNLSDGKICKSNEKIEDTCCSTPRKITWANQGQIPCILRHEEST